MQGLSGVRVVHCSLPCHGRSLAARQHLLLVRLRQPSSCFRSWNNAWAPAVLKLRASLQDGVATGIDVSPLEDERVSANLTGEELTMGDVALEEGPKVSVEFALEKKCHYGQRFNVVGNHPLLGSWDVGAAIPMEWADGDIWTVEVEVPAGKQFEFKFVLTGEKGEVAWQPGSNRVFNTEESVSPLVVNELWDSVSEAAAVEVEDDESRDPVPYNTNTSSETDGTLVPDEEDVKDEMVDALESTADATDGQATASELDAQAAPEIPMAELDIAATAVTSAVGVDDTA